MALPKLEKLALFYLIVAA